MLEWSILLLVFSKIRLAHALAFTPLPTSTQHMGSVPPHPTPGFQLHRRANGGSSSSVVSGYQTTSTACGWLSTLIYSDDSNFGCSEGNTCVYHASDNAFPGLVGCCSGDDCGFASACYDKTAMDATPTLISTNDPFAIFCTDEAAPACATYTWEGDKYTNFNCEEVSSVYTVYTTGIWEPDESGDGTPVTQFATTINDAAISRFTSLYNPSTPPPNLGVKKSSTASNKTKPTPKPTAAGSTNSGSSTSTGAIAGGVVGGLAGGAAIGAGAIFLFLKKKKKTRQENKPSVSDDAPQPGYQIVPQVQSTSGHSSSQMQQVPSEVEASDPVHKFTEVPGSTPQNATQETGSQKFIAELPETHDR